MLLTLLLYDMKRQRFHCIYYSMFGLVILVALSVFTKIDLTIAPFVIAISFQAYLMSESYIRDRRMIEAFLSGPICIYHLLIARTIYFIIIFMLMYLLIACVVFFFDKVFHLKYLVTGMLISSLETTLDKKNIYNNTAFYRSNLYASSSNFIHDSRNCSFNTLF
jgi:type IV secretory pathway VirB3-like protein